ncbi:hypothetical protein ACTVCO_02015 [Sanguibacter sp. A247]|uniref:hypothetical protein n=1 Tax=unclassified Sanguibacter TaxID=2645534 RepID=UPI003FD87774
MDLTTLTRRTNSGLLDDRIALAAAPDLDARIYAELAHDRSTLVRHVLAENDAVPRDVLVELVAGDPDLADVVALRREAPAALKEPLPVTELSPEAIDVYSADRGADPATRVRLQEARSTYASETLGEAYRRLTSR